jgi:hypothetical protein
MIEHGRSGYLLDFDNDPVAGDWRWLYCQKKPGYVDAYWQESEKMAHELAERLARAWEDRKNYEAMSAAAIQRVTKRFSIAQAQRRLAPLYEIARSRRRGVLCLASENSSTSMNINASVESGTFANNLPCLRDALPSAPRFRSSAKN